MVQGRNRTWENKKLFCANARIFVVARMECEIAIARGDVVRCNSGSSVELVQKSVTKGACFVVRKVRDVNSARWNAYFGEKTNE